MATAEISDHVLDEIWLIMHMAAETGIQHRNFQSAEEDDVMLECETEDSLPDTEDHIEDDHADILQPQSKKAAVKHIAATLKEIGDEYMKEHKQSQNVDELSKEIADYIKSSAANLKAKLQTMLPDMSRQIASSFFQQSGILSLIYDGFKSKVENFVDPSKEVANIGLIFHITQGVAQGLDQSLFGTSDLLATMATNLIKEKYGSVLQGKKELTQVVRENS